jgi:hypothetical protein
MTARPRKKRKRQKLQWCYLCGKKTDRVIGFCKSHELESPPRIECIRSPEVTAVKESRIPLYALRASARLPLFPERKGVPREPEVKVDRVLVGEQRLVYASSKELAIQTAVYGQRLTGAPRRARKAIRAERVYPRTNAPVKGGAA